jgi:GAF domain-containing protein
MLNQVRTFLRAPIFPDDEDKTRKARYAHAIALAFLGIAVIYEAGIRIFLSYTEVSPVDLMIFGLIMTCAVSLMMLRQGHVYAASMLLVVLIWFVINSIASTGYGAQDASFITNFTVVLMAALLLNWQASLIITVLSILSGIGLAYAEQQGLIVHPAYPITSFARDIAFVLAFNAVIIYLLINGLETALKRSRANAEKFETSNVNLNHTQSELQHRTDELVIVNEQLENRTEKLRAIAAITSTAASIHDFEGLISSVSSIVSQQLGYFHVGVFLLDEQRQYAILRSASSASGLKMLTEGYRLPVKAQHIISFAAQSGQPQLTLDTGTNPELLSHDVAQTRSQLVLPLKSGDEIVGILDLQSNEVNAFREDDISTLVILADQIGIAIQNALLYEQSQSALREANLTFRQASEKEWKGYAEAVQAKGYRYDGIKPEPLKESHSSSAEGNALSIPVQLRGQTIGRLRLHPSDTSRQWTEDELAMIEATAERAALALEGARLLEEAQKRAAREAFLSGVAAKLSTSFQLDSILRDTVEELGQTLHGSIVSFQLVNPSAPVYTEARGAEETPANGKKADTGA